MIKIVGAKGNISNVEDFLTRINDLIEEKKIEIQVFNADMIYGKNHLISATEHAIRSIYQDKNTTNSLGMEILLYASGERQLKIAIPKIGVKKGKGNIAFVFIADSIPNNLINSILKDIDLERDDKVLEGDINTLKKFGLKDIEISTVSENEYEDLILEKVAMVDLIK